MTLKRPLERKCSYFYYSVLHVSGYEVENQNSKKGTTGYRHPPEGE